MNDGLPNLTVHQMRYVREAATAPTLSIAAARLGVSQPALTQGLAEVERRLGVALFDRTGRTRRPTPMLADVLTVANQILGAVDDLTRRIAEREAGQLGTLRVGMIDTAALGPFADVLANFGDQYPGVEFTLAVDGSVALSQRVAHGDLDLAIVVAPNVAIDRQHVEVTPLVDEPLRVYLTKHAGSDRHRWGPWVTYPADSETRRLIEMALARMGIAFHVVAESSNPDVLRQMVRVGVGSCVLPVAVAETGRNPLAPADLEPVAIRTLSLIRRRAGLFNPAADAFARLIAQTEGRTG